LKKALSKIGKIADRGDSMFRQEKQGSASSHPGKAVCKKTSHKMFLVAAGIIAIIVIGAALSVPSLLKSPNAGEPMSLSLNYTTGERMVYRSTATVDTEMSGSTLATPRTTSNLNNFTTYIDVLGLENGLYRINETVSIQQNPDANPSYYIATLFNVNTTNYYNYLMAPIGPYVFYNVTNPTLQAYLNQPEVKVGDVWTIPVESENTNVNTTGEVKLTFTEFQDFTVPAGTFRVMRVDITSGPLSLNSYGLTVTIQFHGQAYIERSTGRLIKAEVAQESTENSNGTVQTSTVHNDETLIEVKTP
jgi:hypothetical protein